MHAHPIEIVPVSPDRYCPYCRRILFRIVPDEGMILSGRASFTMVSTIDPFDLPEDGQVDGFIEAKCLRRNCRIRSWWQNRRSR